MKKRILAMLLVLCLVASVMPMTVLAAEAKCPGKGKDHTLDNCDATLVIEVPAENCLQQSYDLYKCDKCGALFAANFGAWGSHDYQWPEWLPEDERPSCGAGKVCFNEHLGDECGATLDHNFGCDGKCSCGAEGVPGHTWLPEDIVITKQPVGCAVPGEATYHCAKCDATKVAPVYGKHIEKKHVGYKAPDCKNTGIKEHDYCSGCGTYWINGEEVEADDVIIPAQHELPVKIEERHASVSVGYQEIAGPNGFVGLMIVEVLNSTAKVDVTWFKKGTWQREPNVYATFDKTEGVFSILLDGSVNPGVRVYAGEADVKVTFIAPEDLENWVPATCDVPGIYEVKCEKCDELVTVKTALTAHRWILDEQKSQTPTCDRYGYEIWFCDACGEMKPIKRIPKVECIDTWLEVQAYNKDKKDEDKTYAYELKPTCMEKGKREWQCPHCLEVFEQTLKATGCKLVTATIAPTKCTKGYTYKYCANENCDNVEAHAGYFYDNVSGGMVPLAVVSALTGKDVHKVDVVTKTNPMADHNWVLGNTSATCTEAGYEFYYCSNPECNAVKGPIAVAAYGHSGYSTDDEDSNYLWSEEATHNTRGWSGYWCLDCDQWVVVTENVPFVHKPLLSYEDAVKYHGDYIPAFDDIAWIIEPTCDRVGYATIKCTYCELNEVLDGYKHNITIFAGGSHNFGDVSGLDCLDPAVPCQNGCGEFYKVEHKWSIPAVKGDCFTEGYSAYGVCSICGETKESPDEVYPAGHNWSNDAPIVATCKKWGGQPQTCSRGCGYTQIIDYVANTHYIGEGGTISIDYAKSTDFYKWIPAEDLTVEESYIFIDGMWPVGDDDVVVYEDGELKGVYQYIFEECIDSGKLYYSCSVCSYENVENKVGLGYHVDQWGNQIHTDKCPDCIMKMYNYVDVYNWQSLYQCKYCCDGWEIVLKNLGMQPTCTDPGYGVYEFTCGHNGYMGYIDPLGHRMSTVKSTVTTGEFANLYKANKCLNGCGLMTNPETLNNVEIVIKNDLKKDEVLHDGAEVKVTISLKAYSAEMFGYSFDLNYDPAVLQLVDFAPLSELFPYNANVNTGIEEVKPAVIENGKVKEPAVLRHYVRVMGQKYADGKNAVVEGYEQLVELTFKVNNPGKLETALKIHSNLEIYKNDKVKNDTVLAPVVCINPDAQHKLAIRKLMDANNDGTVDYLDCATVWQLYSGVLKYEYRENLDLNHNGEIDHVDANLIYKFFAGYISYAEVLNYEA